MHVHVRETAERARVREGRSAGLVKPIALLCSEVGGGHGTEAALPVTHTVHWTNQRATGTKRSLDCEPTGSAAAEREQGRRGERQHEERQLWSVTALSTGEKKTREEYSEKEKPLKLALVCPAVCCTPHCLLVSVTDLFSESIEVADWLIFVRGCWHYVAGCNKKTLKCHIIGQSHVWVKCWNRRNFVGKQGMSCVRG